MSHCDACLPIYSFMLNYLQSGQSFLINDAEFGVIEKSKKYYKKDIYIPKDWMQFVREARSKKPFNVVEMGRSDLIDLGLTSMQVIHRKKTTEGLQVQLLNIRTILYEQSNAI